MDSLRRLHRIQLVVEPFNKETGLLTDRKSAVSPYSLPFWYFYIGKSFFIKDSVLIVPPYNMGNGFVYEDDFEESTDEYLAYSGHFDNGGNRLEKILTATGAFITIG